MRQQITFAAWPVTPAVKALLIINAVCWLLTIFISKMAPALLFRIALVPDLVWPGLHIWQVFTYMWLHDPGGMSHILFNSLFLWMFGGTLEQAWGRARFIKFYLACGLGAGLLAFAVGKLFNPVSPVLGASGAIYGLVAAWGILNPERLVYLFGVLPIKGKFFILLPIGYAFLDFLTGGTGTSHSAHLGGLAMGALYVTGYWRPGQVTNRLRYHFLKRKLKVIEGQNQKSKPKDGDRNPNGGYWN